MNDTSKTPLDELVDGVHRDLEEEKRPQWKREWRQWWRTWERVTPGPARDVLEWALDHHSEGDPFDQKAEATLGEVAPERGTWEALRNWYDTVTDRAEECLEKGPLSARPNALPAPPFVPTEEELAGLTDGVERTPIGAACAFLAHLGHVAQHHHEYLQPHTPRS
jgi:hypothetical protein